MLTKEQIDDLRKRMVNHSVVNDTAVVVITARELEELLWYVNQYDILFNEQACDDHC